MDINTHGRNINMDTLANASNSTKRENAAYLAGGARGCHS